MEIEANSRVKKFARDCFRAKEAAIILSYLWYFIRHLVGLHGLFVVGLPTEAHLKGGGFPILLQLSHHRDLWEAVQSRLKNRTN